MSDSQSFPFDISSVRRSDRDFVYAGIRVPSYGSPLVGELLAMRQYLGEDKDNLIGSVKFALVVLSGRMPEFGWDEQKVSQLPVEFIRRLTQWVTQEANDLGKEETEAK